MRQLIFERVRVCYQKEVPTKDLVDLVEELSNDFMTVETSRQNFRIAASGLAPDVGVVVVLGVGAVAVGFLNQLGKDLYRGLRRVIFRLYDSIRLGATGTGRVWPFAIRVGFEEQTPPIFFILDEGLTEQQFEEAVVAIPTALQPLSQQFHPSVPHSLQPVARYDVERKAWYLWP